MRLIGLAMIGPSDRNYRRASHDSSDYHVLQPITILVMVEVFEMYTFGAITSQQCVSPDLPDMGQRATKESLSGERFVDALGSPLLD